MKYARALLLLSALPLFAQDPWDAPAFSAEPEAMLASAAKVKGSEDGVVILLDEAVHTFEADGRKRTVTRLIYRIDEEAAVATNDSVSALWQPWFDERPVIEARVITKDGTVHTLDAKAITEAPAKESALDIFSDNRVLRAPLPAVAVGSIVEHTVTTAGRSPIEGAGVSGLFVLGRWVPLHRARLVLDGPADIQPRIVNRSGLEPSVEEANGRRRITFTSDRREKLEKLESYVPFDEAAYPYIAFSTGSSWQQIASHYATLVDKQIAGSDLKKLVESAAGKAKKPREITARILAAIQKEVRYAGVEVGEGSIIPRTPATVLQNKYGDCKDKATLLVAMLREAGLTAHVALLRAGLDLDAHADLPGLDRFNHAIVRVVDGKDEIWIDPTDEFARAGELPIADQGRMALIAAAGTTSLTRTPEVPSTANRYAETRIFNLNEHGKAPVVEITETAGPHDAIQRRYYVTTAAEQYRETMERYAKSYWLARALQSMNVSDPHDLETPFKVTLEVKESGSGVVLNGEGSVALHPAALFNTLPDSLSDWEEPEPDDDPDDAPKPRERDFVFPQPIVKEWTYRIVPPAGYLPRELPAGQNRKLGTTTFTSEYSADANGVVTAKLRFDTGRRRINAKEYEETRVAISKFLDEPQINIGFDMIGRAKLTAGDVAGALAEFRRLAALHPNEAQHHIELAGALLSGGLGEPAREEARLAVKIEPNNARAHLALGQVLLHDLLGRPYRKGSDIPAAIDSMRKAKELDPQNIDVRAQLARTLKRDADGIEFGAGAKLAESAAEYRALAKDFGEKGRAHDGELMLVLAYDGKFEELKQLAATVEDKQQRNVGRLIAVAATEGKDALLRELSRFDLETRRTYAQELGEHLMDLRYYPEAAAMYELAQQGKAGSPETAFLIDALKNAKRLESGAVREDDPTTVMPRVLIALVKGDTNAVLDVLAPEAREEAEKELAKEDEDPLAFVRGSLASDDMRPAVMADLFSSMLQTNKDSDGADGYRVRHRAAGETESMAIFVTKDERGRYLMRAYENDQSLGRAVLDFLDKGQLDRARIWLNWGRETLESGDADDPLSRQAFAMIWPKAKRNATADEIRVAAAVQIAQSTDERVDLLVSLREKTASDATKLAIDRALAGAYAEARRWTDLLPVARRLYEAHPDSTFAFNQLGTALAFTGRHDEAAALANERLEQLPDDRDALRVLAQNAGAKHDYAAAATYAQQVLDQTSAKRDDFNNAAWYGLMTGNLERAIAHALQATDEDKNDEGPNAAALHTLASLYAESDKPLQAREALLRSMAQRQRDQPKDEDWYVLGRIAETYGVRDAAVAAYTRVPKEKSNDSDTGLAELVARRVAKLR